MANILYSFGLLFILVAGNVYADERNLLFITASDVKKGRYDIYSFNPVNQKHKKIISNGLNPKWSPDGKKIAYLAISIGDYNIMNINLAVADADGSDAKMLANINRMPAMLNIAWSPDGKMIAFTNSNDVLICDLKNQAEILYTGKTEAGNIGWSKDSKHLMFWYPSSGIYLMDIKTKIRKEILPPLKDFPVPEFIPGTSTLVFLAYERDAQAGDRGTLMMMDIFEKKPTVLAEGIEYLGLLKNNYKFSGDGKKLFFNTIKEEIDLSVVDISSKTVKQYKNLPCHYQAISYDGTQIAGICKFPDGNVGYGIYNMINNELKDINKFGDQPVFNQKILMFYGLMEW